MAKYKLGAHRWYHEGTLYPAGSIVTIADDSLPSVTWEPLDEAGHAAMAKLKKILADRVALAQAAAPATSPVDFQKAVDAAVAAKVDAAIAAALAKMKGPPATPAVVAEPPPEPVSTEPDTFHGLQKNPPKAKRASDKPTI